SVQANINALAVQACHLPVREPMGAHDTVGWTGVDHDFLAGSVHHQKLTARGNKPIAVGQALARDRLGGAGLLPEDPSLEVPLANDVAILLDGHHPIAG